MSYWMRSCEKWIAIAMNKIMMIESINSKVVVMQVFNQKKKKCEIYETQTEEIEEREKNVVNFLIKGLELLKSVLILNAIFLVLISIYYLLLIIIRFRQYKL